MFCFKLSPVNDVFTKEKEKHKPLQELSLPMFGFWNDYHIQKIQTCIGSIIESF